MARWFYHPLGDYAKNYVDGTANSSQFPHTREKHGFNKIDYGCGYNLPIYSMTDGIVVTARYIGDDGKSKYGVVIKCTNNGYSEMMAKIKNASPMDYPIYISYIEMDREPEVTVGESVSPGTLLGYTSNVYPGSNVHIDIGTFDRYGGDGKNNPNLISLANGPHLALGMDRWDNYGDKGEDFDFTKYLSSLMSVDSNNNIIDTTGKPIGVLSNDNLYYPIDYNGNPVKVQMNSSYPHYNTNPSPCPINRFYHYALAMQTPVYKKANTSSSSSSDQNKYDSNCDIRNYITFTEEERQAALGVMSYEAGNNAPNCSLECWGRVLRNRICQGYNNNLENCARGWLGRGASYSKQNALKYYKNIYSKYSKEQQDLLWGTICGNNYGYIETAIKNGQGGFESTKYGNIDYLYNLNMLGKYHWWNPNDLIAWIQGSNGRISPGYAPDVNKNKKLFNCPEWLKNGL